jgi:hypothetical protein
MRKTVVNLALNYIKIKMLTLTAQRVEANTCPAFTSASNWSDVISCTTMLTNHHTINAALSLGCIRKFGFMTPDIAQIN